MQAEEEKESAVVRDAIRKRLRKYFRETLKPLGFVSNSTGQRWRRSSETLKQTCMFYFPRPWYVRIEFSYALIPCFDCWEDVPQDPQTQLTFARFKEVWLDFSRGTIDHSIMKDWDTPSTVEEIDALLSEIDVYTKQEALPLLDKYRHAADILRDYDLGIISGSYICGSSGWFDFNLALLRYQEKKYAETLQLFQNFLMEFEESRELSDFWKYMLSGVEIAVDLLKKRLAK